MVRKHIRSYEDVSKLVLDYFSRPRTNIQKSKSELRMKFEPWTTAYQST